MSDSIKQRSGAAGASLADQIVCSLGNFLAFVLVARSQGPGGAGEYGVAIALITILGGLQNALLTGPMRFVGAALTEVGRVDYLRATSSAQLIVAVVLSLLTALGVALAFGSAWGAVLAIACATQLCQQYARAVATMTLDMRALLASDLWTHGIRLAGIAALAWSGQLNAMTAITMFAFGSAIGAFRAGRLRPAGQELTRRVMRQNWAYGKWLILETLAFYASTHLYLILVASFLGTFAAGVFGALQNLFNVVNVFVAGLCNVVPTIARRQLILSGVKAWRTTLMLLAIACIGAALCFVTVITLFGDAILSGLYGPKYIQETVLLAALGLAYIMSSANTVLGATFRTVERPDVGAWAKLISGCMAVGFAPLLLTRWEIEGAVAGLIATHIIWLLVYLANISAGALSAEMIERARARGITNAADFR